MKNRIILGIRGKFLIAFFVSLITGFLVFLAINGNVRNGEADFSSEIDKANSQCGPVISKINRNINNFQELQRIVNQNISQFYIFITDSTGRVLIKPNNQIVDHIDIQELERQYKENAIQHKSASYASNEIVYNKLEHLNNGYYIVINMLLKQNDVVGAGLIGIVVFILLFFMLTFQRIRYIKLLSDSLKVIANGNLDCKVTLKGKDELTILAGNINNMADELRARKQKEEAAEQTKNELIANMSHDLRTPLTSILGYTKLLKEKNRQNEIVKYLNIIDDKSQRLDALIGDLLDFTILNNCEVKLQKDNVSLNELLRQVIEGMLPLANQSNITLACVVPKSEIIVHIDASKMARVFENIISNAIKYSNSPAQVDIALTKEADKAIVCIQNAGRSIAKEDIHKIFDRLYRTDEARNSKTGGAGIGLSIAKSIVDLHNGSIWAENTENGASFYVSLSLNPV